MTESVGKPPSFSPEEKTIFKQAYARGAILFQESLLEFEKTNEEFKREKFKQVMEQAKQVMNETAQICLSSKELKLEKKLEADYQQFLQESTKENIEKLYKDLTEIQRKL